MNPLSAWNPALLRALAAGAVVFAYAVLCGFIIWRERRARRAAALERAALAPAVGDAQADGPVWLIAFASQTGFAEQIAWQSARLFHTAGVPVRLLALGELTLQELARTERALFIVSTYGEGDAPDNAARFAQAMTFAAPLANLHHAVLALGDRGYAQFCGFGRRVDAWLQAQGATRLFDRIELDNEDPAAWQAWQRHVAHLAGTVDLPDWQAPAFEDWRLVSRRVLNPGSLGAPVCHLELEPMNGALPDWQAGDLVQVRAPDDAARPREYTIASVPSAGSLQLMVRLERHADGAFGCASGWLTTQLQVGDGVPLRLRTHASFRIGGNASRPLLLIGNGTGLAGLRAHLMARAGTPDAPPAWLLFGERQSAHDRHYADEIAAWQAEGVLAQVDWVFSRDQPERLHVQHRLIEQAPRVREWVADGAAIYVCGSLQGMAGAVDAALAEILGAENLAALAEAGRYRRDVY